MKKTIIVAIAALAALFTACEPVRSDGYEYYDQYYVFSIVNNTPDTLVWFVPPHGSVPCEAVTGELPEEMTETLEQYFFVANPLRQTAFSCNNRPPLSPIEEYHPEDLVTFYFFSPKVLRETPWSEIVENKLWLARYTYSARQVIDMNKLISYPERTE